MSAYDPAAYEEATQRIKEARKAMWEIRDRVPREVFRQVEERIEAAFDALARAAHPAA